ncbi:hypothetical protein, partial [Chromobacterium alticapitis]
MNPLNPSSAAAASRQERHCLDYAALAALAAISCVAISWLAPAASALWLGHAAPLALLAATLFSAAASARWRRRRQALAPLPWLPAPLRTLSQTLAAALLRAPPSRRAPGRLLWPRARRWIGRRLGWSLARLAAGSALALFPAWLSLSQALSTPPAAAPPLLALAAAGGM